MLSWATPFPVSAVTSNFVPKSTRGVSVFVFSYNVEKCCTVQGGNCTPPRKTHGAETHFVFLAISTQKHGRTPQLSMLNSLLVVSSVIQ